MASSPTVTPPSPRTESLALPVRAQSPFPEPPLLRSTALTPAAYEKKKTSQQKAEDVIYTLNHAVTCLSITDTIGLGAAGNLAKFLTNSDKLPKWAQHDHGDGGYSAVGWIKDRLLGKHKNPVYVDEIKAANAEAHHAMHQKPDSHHDHGPAIHPQSSTKEMLKKAWHDGRSWIIGEAVGDLGAVPLTVGLQRMAPGFMDSLRRGMEPFIGGMFRKNTRKAAENWGASHGKAADSQEVVNYAHELYEYEMHHMPQMAVWTVLSVGLNFAVMIGLHKWKPDEFHGVSPAEFMIGKGIGAAMTGGLVLGVRGLTPGGAHWWDKNIGKHVILPITKVVGAPFGVKTEDVETFHKRTELLEGHLQKKSGTVGNTPTTQVSDISQPEVAREQADWQVRVHKQADAQAAVQGIGA